MSFDSLHSQVKRIEGMISRAAHGSSLPRNRETKTRPTALSRIAKNALIKEPIMRSVKPEALIFDEPPLSVSVVRRAYRFQKKEHEALEPAVIPNCDDPVSPLESERYLVVNLSYASVLRPLTRDGILQTVETELRQHRPVRLRARLADNDRDFALCRLALRTLYAALHPSLVEPIPPPPTDHGDALSMTLQCNVGLS